MSPAVQLALTLILVVLAVAYVLRSAWRYYARVRDRGGPACGGCSCPHDRQVRARSGAGVSRGAGGEAEPVMPQRDRPAAQ